MTDTLELSKTEAPPRARGDFHQFSKAIEKRFREMADGELYAVQIADLFGNYLDAFPAGANPIFRVRTEHDCSCCKSFVRNVGHLVSLKGGQISTVWDVPGLEYPYDIVAARLSEHVRSHAISSVFRTKEGRFGAPVTNELRDDATIRWHHFFCDVPGRFRSNAPEAARGDISTTAQVLRRGLEEFTHEAIATVADLIASNTLYRGAEFQSQLNAFSQLHAAYPREGSPGEKDAFVWSHVGSSHARFRNTVIGTLVQDLSAGEDLEASVRSYEKKVAPENYKRPTALITPRMIEDAVAKLRDLGLESAVERRFARISDVSVNNVLFVDNAVRGSMKDGLTSLLMEAARPATVDVKGAEPISMEDFLSRIVPQATSIDLLVENKHLPNFMSLTAPVHSDAGKLFKWNNGFAWSYDGDVADSMRQRVQSRGGRVDGVLRFTHQWNDVGRNASLMDLHIFMPGHQFTKTPCAEHTINDTYGDDRRIGWNRRNDPSSRGVQDVDYTAQAPEGYIPVENITFPDLWRMPEGDYVMKIHNWHLRAPTTSAFKAEIEFAGQVFQYEHPQPLKHKEWVPLAVVTLRGGSFSIRHLHPTTTSSQGKWGVNTETLVPVDTLLASPNHWDGQATGNKHWFFILKDCRNPAPTRGIYNEFLSGALEPHRKVFEVLGAKTKCPPTNDQLSGVGFSSTRHDKATVVVKGDRINRAFNITF